MSSNKSEDSKSKMTDKEIQQKESKSNPDIMLNPDDYEEYLRVTTPKTWLVLGAILSLLVGFSAWCFFGHIEINSGVTIVKQENANYALIPQDYLEEVSKHPWVKVDDVSYDLTSTILNPVTVSDSTNSFIKLQGQLSNGAVLYPVGVDAHFDEEYVAGTVVSDTISPISLLLNN